MTQAKKPKLKKKMDVITILEVNGKRTGARTGAIPDFHRMTAILWHVFHGMMLSHSPGG